MSETSVKPVTPSTAVTDAPAAPQAKPRPAKNVVVQALEAIGSLRVTVVLFAMGLVLVFFGTLAQIDGGIWNVMDKYFRSFFVWMPLQLLVQFGQIFLGLPKDMRLGGALPFPGGFSIGIALLINMVAAYSLRIPRYFEHWKNYALMITYVAAVCVAGYFAATELDQWWFLSVCGVLLVGSVVVLAPFYKLIFFPGNRIGIIVLHVGLVVMLVGEFMTAAYAVEGNMVIEEGETTNAVIHNRYHEIAFVDSSDKNEDDVTVIPGRLLKNGATLSNKGLPCDVTVVKWLPASGLRELEDGDKNPADTGFGLKRLAVEQSETAGAASKQTVDTPSVYVKLTDKKNGEVIGTYLLSVLLKEQTIKIGDTEYDVSLRFKHTYKPYSLRLEEFRFDRYPGTQTPKNFSSKVTLRDKDRGDDRVVTIRMNEPLRHRGDTFFQADWNKDTEKGTVLQVVRNPAWQLPYWSCAIVAIGMLLHFGINLINFLARMSGQAA